MRALLLGLLLTLPGCAGGRERLPPPPAAPVVSEPARLIPADLDLVLRVDVTRVAAVLGLQAERDLERLLQRAPVEEPDFATRRLLLSLLARTRTLWIGVRPGLAPELTDNVLVLRGDFAGLLPTEVGGSPPWRGPHDLGGDWRRYERAAPTQRAAPAVLYVRSGDLAIFGSVAEMDALERTIEGGQPDSGVQVPDTGSVSLGARLPSLRSRLVETAPSVAKLMRGAESLQASVDLASGYFELNAELRFDAPERAPAVAEALRAVSLALEGPLGQWLQRAKIEAVERFVTLRLRAPEADVLRLLRCWSAEGCGTGDTVPAP
ncbi:MAG TPA: hypothetical protein VER33_20100 [Polyangiaceae bacterium]|nr:hypothetical protein [Polyangiaceae bacterium]